jgi:hypothetical protein
MNPIPPQNPTQPETRPEQRGKYQTAVMQRNAISAPKAAAAIQNAGL